MTQLDDVCRQLGVVDYTLMVIVEDRVGIGKPATPVGLAALISGAPAQEVRRYLDRLVFLGALDKTPESYRVTNLGAAVLERNVDDWEPAPSEQMRREIELVRARLK